MYFWGKKTQYSGHVFFHNLLMWQVVIGATLLSHGSTTNTTFIMHHSHNTPFIDNNNNNHHDILSRQVNLRVVFPLPVSPTIIKVSFFLTSSTSLFSTKKTKNNNPINKQNAKTKIETSN